MVVQPMPRFDGGDLALKVDALRDLEQFFDYGARGRPAAVGFVGLRALWGVGEEGGGELVGGCALVVV